MFIVDWITEELLKKIEGNPSLAKLLLDPTFTAALSQVQTDPVKALAMLESHPEMQKALQDLSGILGEHFTTLGNARGESVRMNLIAVLMLTRGRNLNHFH